MNKVTPFHVAFPVDDLKSARAFYGEVLGCPEGRSSSTWVDFNLFGHQIVAHLATGVPHRHSNPVDQHDVPVPHFGVVLEWDDFFMLAERVRGAGIKFVISPYLRFSGEAGEQMTMFFLDPAGNALEFKSFREMGQLFAK